MNLNLYNSTTWAPLMPITQGRMNNLEEGVKDNRDAIIELDGAISSLNTTISGMQSDIQARPTTLAVLSLIELSAGQGTWARTEIVTAFEGDTYTSLKQRFDTDETKIANLKATFGTKTVNNNVVDAYSPTNTVYSAVSSISENVDLILAEVRSARTDGVKNSSYDSLYLHLYNIDNLMDSINAEVTTIIAASGKDANNLPVTLATRINQLLALKAEVEAAHREVEAGAPADTLNARFNDIETLLTLLRDNKVNVSDVINDFTHTDTNKPLSANMGKTLKDTIGGSYSPTSTVASAISTALSTAEANALAYADANKISTTAIYNALDQTTAGYVLDARQGKVLNDNINSVSSAHATLATDVSSISSAVNLLNSNASTTGSVAYAVTEGIGRVVAEAPEAFDTLKEIADWIGTHSTTALEMLQNIQSNSAAIATLSTSVTTIQNTISNSTTGLAVRINNLEEVISDTATGLAAVKDIADGAVSSVSSVSGRLETLNGIVTTTGTGLVDRVTALETEPKSATVIIDNVTYNNDGIPTNISNPSTDADYLLKKDDKYYYWKYIKTGSNPDTFAWAQISGGNGTGTSSAEILSLLPSTNEADENVDYYIGNNNSGFTHYRYYNNAWIQILPAHLINSVSVDSTTVSETAHKSRPIIKELGSETNLLANFDAIQYFNAVAVENGYKLTWIDIDGTEQDITITGGSGGSNTNINVSIDRITNSNITTIAGENCSISYTFNATEASGSTYETTGSGVWAINGARVATQEVANGDNTFNIQPYLHNGTNNITLSVTITADGLNITRTKTWVVNVINFSLVWEYEESTINTDANINFSCVPYGTDITKTLHLKVGSHTQAQTVTTSGIPTTVTLVNNFTHGNYTAEMWMTATINGIEKTTPHILHDFIVVEQGNTTPIIAATLPSSTINLYDTISIPFVVYTPTTSLSTVTLAANGVVQDIRPEVNRMTQTWYYTPSTLGTDIIYDEDENPISGTHTLTITSGATTKTLILTVNNINVNNSEISGYAFKLKASELPSNSALQAWQYDENNNNTKLQFSNNFDWINGGIQTERDSNGLLRQYIRIKTGTTMTIPYKMFYGVDPRENGSNFKIIFKVENCRNYDAVVATTVADNIGIQLNAHNAVFKSTTTQVSTLYGENEYTELEFEVYKSHLTGGVEAPNPYMMAWIDGVMTSARPYDGNFVLTEVNAKNIVIGSTDCDVCVYLVKYYPTVLSIADHISNFIADAPNAAEMIRRYSRNDILDEDGDISFSKLADKNRDCRVWLYDIPRMTTGKKDYVAGVGFLQIYKNGTAYQDGLHGKGTLTVQGTSSVNYRKGAANTDINFYDTKDGRLASCELFDGEDNNLLYDVVNNENVAKPEAERGYKINTDSTPITYSNMKVNFASCEQVNNMCNAEWYQLFLPYPSLSTRDCMEFAMGVQFIHDKGEGEPSGEVILFNEKGANRNPNKYYMYSIGNLGTSKKNTHIFHSANECCIEVMNNLNAGCRMVSMPSDLLADYTAYQNEEYESMTNYDWGGDNKAKDHSYEMRFPDTKNPEKEIKAGWARFVKWMVDNNPNAATNESIPSETYGPYTFKGHKRAGTQVLKGTTVNQYAGTYTTDSFNRRMAKMLSECEDYMAMDSVVYHFLFIERHTMVDNVSKNTFWSAEKTNQYINSIEQEDTEGYWIWDLSKNYDNDTSDGNNNEGLLIFDYGNEANDMQDGKAIFNASDAVWFIFISNLYEACLTMFLNREGAVSKNGKWQNAWNASAYHNYLLSELQKVPERVWNECYWYDYLRTYETGKVYNEETDKDTQIIDKSWITFLDGGQKTHQRLHYETFEELYDASKYRSNFSTANSITLRGYTPESNDPSLLAVPAKSEISVKMYNKCYLTAHFDNNIESLKVERGETVTLSFLEGGEYMHLSDTVIKIDTASMIQEIGDLAPLYPGQASFSAAVRLRSIKIGDSTPGYNNPHITNTETGTVDFGANYMLEHLEVQNLSNANQPLNLTGCPALSYLDASGSNFTSVTFANGGLLTEAYINNPTSLTMRNLDLLTLANLHITDLTTLTQLRLEGCILFDKLSFVESLTNLNIIRLSGINWTLNTNTLLDSLLNMMGMNELGNTISLSYLAGNVKLTGTVYEGIYNSYVAAWSPDLIIDKDHATNFIAQHLVTYYDEDGITKLHKLYIDTGTSLIDPYNNLTSIPTKAADIQNTYLFGTQDAFGDYIPFSGWRLEDDTISIYEKYHTSTPSISVSGPMSVYAVYSSTPQKYVVRWLVRNIVVKTSDPLNYGGGYELINPTIEEIQAKASTYSFSSLGNNMCSYSIMQGWDKLPTNITSTLVGGTYDINATWLERTNVNYLTVLNDNSGEYKTEEKLLILKMLLSARTDANYGFGIRDIFPITLGYKGPDSGIDLVSSPTRFNGTPTVLNQYTPFALNKSFTLAIDYRFLHVINDTPSEAVLVSCFDDSIDGSILGFKLFYNPRSVNTSPVPQISFGDTGGINASSRIKTIGSSINDRNVVVLRHNAGSDTLYIYSGANLNGLITTMNVENFRLTISWSGISTNAPIVLGGKTSTNASMMNATGMIYSARYWEEDLGEGECLLLANWCNETINLAVTDYAEIESSGGNHSAINNTLNANIVLHALNASEMGTITESSIPSTGSIGWGTSDIRTFYNDRIYHAFPITLLSIMNPFSIPYLRADRGTELYELNSTVLTSDDYVFAPSFIELTNNTAGTATISNHAVEANGSIGWSGMIERSCAGNSLAAPTAANSMYTNLRFPYLFNRVNTTITIYSNYSETSSFYQWINGKSITLKSGDILIVNNDETPAAYVYVSAQEASKGAPIITNITNSALTNTVGGWIEAVTWSSRSVPDSISGTAWHKFVYITGLGEATTGRRRVHNIVYSIAL